MLVTLYKCIKNNNNKKEYFIHALGEILCKQAAH